MGSLLTPVLSIYLWGHQEILWIETFQDSEINLLLSEFEGGTVSYGPSFFLLAGHKSKGKKRGSVTYSTDRENEVSKIFIISLVCVWGALARFRRRTSHEPNRIQWIKFMWSMASESIRNGWYNSDRLSRSSRLAQPGIRAVYRLLFRRRSSHQPNQIHKLI